MTMNIVLIFFLSVAWFDGGMASLGYTLYGFLVSVLWCNAGGLEWLKLHRGPDWRWPRWLILILAIRSAAGCGPYKYRFTSPEGVTEQQSKIDRYECERDARGGIPRPGMGGQFLRCMESKGYALDKSPRRTTP
jgi:hypothetical protein